MSAASDPLMTPREERRPLPGALRRVIELAIAVVVSSIVFAVVINLSGGVASAQPSFRFYLFFAGVVLLVVAFGAACYVTGAGLASLFTLPWSQEHLWTFAISVTAVSVTIAMVVAVILSDRFTRRAWGRVLISSAALALLYLGAVYFFALTRIGA